MKKVRMIVKKLCNFILPTANYSIIIKEDTNVYKQIKC